MHPIARRVAGLSLLVLLGLCAAAAGAEAPTRPSTVPAALSPAVEHPIRAVWIVPFVVLLTSIALMPFLFKKWWERYYPLVSVGLGLIAALYYFIAAPTAERWIEGMEDYISFIILLGSLFVVSGGIVIHVRQKDTPLINCVMLLFGAIVANIFGTTGASMLLIRPYLRLNKGHVRPYHIVFFIFIVSNAGGLLTPVGDPPLFLGYLKGVPFWWVMKQCRWMWLATVGLLLAVFYVFDRIDHGRTPRHRPEDPGPAVSIVGIYNLLFILLIVWAVFQGGFFTAIRLMHERGMSAAMLGKLALSREVLMVAAAVGSILLTGKSIYQHNEFTYAPIREVAILFLGIFSTMVPALQWLNVNAEKMPLKSPGQFYFTAGALSSVLDNAPTYLTFLELELGKIPESKVDIAVAELNRMRTTGDLRIRDELDEQVRLALASLVQYQEAAVRNGLLTRDEVRVGFLLGDPKLNLYVIAISMGAVFFGACTYIGNGPNFMVKSIADASGVHTPSFVGYVLKYTLPVLLPVYILVWWIFLRT